MDGKHRANVWSLWEKHRHKHLKCSSKCMEITPWRARLFGWHKRFKEGRVEVKDDTKNERSSTSRTEINIKQVRQVVRGKSAGHEKAP